MPGTGRTGGLGTEYFIDGRWNITYLYDIPGAVRIDSKIKLRKMLVIKESGSMFQNKEEKELKYVRQLKVLCGISDCWDKYVEYDIRTACELHEFSYGNNSPKSR